MKTDTSTLAPELTVGDCLRKADEHIKKSDVARCYGKIQEAMEHLKVAENWTTRARTVNEARL